MAVPPPSPVHKAALRRELRVRRAAFVAALGDTDKDAHLSAIARHLAIALAEGGPIAGYVAHRSEVDVQPVLLAAHRHGRTIALPQVIGGLMRFVEWHPERSLHPGHAGIPQPGEGDPIAPAIMLVPLVGFDRTGHRLGQGGGFYDRWFAAHPQAMRIGVAWSVQEVQALRPDAWDVPLHAIATEKEWIEP